MKTFRKTFRTRHRNKLDETTPENVSPRVSQQNQRTMLSFIFHSLDHWSAIVTGPEFIQGIIIFEKIASYTSIEARKTP